MTYQSNLSLSVKLFGLSGCPSPRLNCNIYSSIVADAGKLESSQLSVLQVQRVLYLEVGEWTEYRMTPDKMPSEKAVSV